MGPDAKYGAGPLVDTDRVPEMLGAGGSIGRMSELKYRYKLTR